MLKLMTDRRNYQIQNNESRLLVRWSESHFKLLAIDLIRTFLLQAYKEVCDAILNHSKTYDGSSS